MAKEAKKKEPKKQEHAPRHSSGRVAKPEAPKDHKQSVEGRFREVMNFDHRLR